MFHAVVLVNIAHAARQSGAVIDLDADGHAVRAHLHAVFDHDEVAARVHGRLVNIHPFPNGNGRCTRLMADVYLASIDQPIFTWGGATLDTDGTNRQRYLDALLRALNNDDYDRLIAFARS